MSDPMEMMKLLLKEATKSHDPGVAGAASRYIGEIEAEQAAERAPYVPPPSFVAPSVADGHIANSLPRVSPPIRGAQ